MALPLEITIFVQSTVYNNPNVTVIIVYNSITLNICLIKGSHKYDVYWRDKNKAHRS